LWIQPDIDNQKIIKEAYFKLFRGFSLPDETYKRNWMFETTKQKEQTNTKKVARCVFY
jgi:hypothetical protein